MPSFDPFELDVRVFVPKMPVVTRMTDGDETILPTIPDDTGFGTDLSRCRACPESLTCSVVQCPTRRRSPCCVIA